MSPEDRALFVQKLHKHRQQVLQSRMQAQQQQRAGHILIRGRFLSISFVILSYLFFRCRWRSVRIEFAATDAMVAAAS